MRMVEIMHFHSPGQMEIYWNESKYEKVSTPKGFIWETKLAANSLI